MNGSEDKPAVVATMQEWRPKGSQRDNRSYGFLRVGDEKVYVHYSVIRPTRFQFGTDLRGHKVRVGGVRRAERGPRATEVSVLEVCPDCGQEAVLEFAGTSFEPELLPGPDYRRCEGCRQQLGDIAAAAEDELVQRCRALLDEFWSMLESSLVFLTSSSPEYVEAVRKEVRERYIPDHLYFLEEAIRTKSWCLGSVAERELVNQLTASAKAAWHFAKVTSRVKKRGLNESYLSFGEVETLVEREGDPLRRALKALREELGETCS